MRWSDIPAELFPEIMKRLDVVDGIRSEAVCVWWRSNRCRRYCRKPQVPWVMLSSTDDDDDDSRYFYSLTEHKTYLVRLPRIAGRHSVVGSSCGYLLSVDDNADLLATDPLNGSIPMTLPPTSTLPDVAAVVRDDRASPGRITGYVVSKIRFGNPSTTEIRSTYYMRKYHYNKALLSPAGDIAVAIHGTDGWLAFARPGDPSWTALETARAYCFDDSIFHKGLLHAVDFTWSVAIFDLDCPSDPPLVSPWAGPLHYQGSLSKRYLVESPEGDDLFLVCKDYVPSRGNNFKVYLLDETTYTWNRIKTLGDAALFLGSNHSTSLNARDFPAIKSNCIYFTDQSMEMDRYYNQPQMARDRGVFHLEDGSVEPVYSDNELDRLNWPPPTWFIPSLS